MSRPSASQYLSGGRPPHGGSRGSPHQSAPPGNRQAAAAAVAAAAPNGVTPASSGVSSNTSAAISRSGAPQHDMALFASVPSDATERELDMLDQLQDAQARLVELDTLYTETIQRLRAAEQQLAQQASGAGGGASITPTAGAKLAGNTAAGASSRGPAPAGTCVCVCSVVSMYVCMYIRV